MNWKFWQKTSPGENNGPKQTKPKEMPQILGRHMVVDLGLDPDWVWALKIVTQEKKGQPGILEFRAYDPSAATIKITGFSSLDHRPELILYDGWYELKGNAKELIPRHHTGNPGETAA